MNLKRISVVLVTATIMLASCGKANNLAATSNPTLIQNPIANPTITSSSAGPVSAGGVLTIPRGSEATVDGTLEEGEWADALATQLNDGSQLYLKYAGDSLYLALDAQVEGTVNVGIIRDGQLQILHSSAALGSAVYESTPEGWQMVKNFEWCCRVGAPESQLDDLVSGEGWLSHNQFRGERTHSEYRIVIPADQIRIAVTYLFMDQSGSAMWPVNLAEEDLLQFSTPPSVGSTARFSEQGWVTLIVED